MILKNAREQEMQENRWLTGNGKLEMLQKRSENRENQRNNQKVSAVMAQFKMRKYTYEQS